MIFMELCSPGTTENQTCDLSMPGSVKDALHHLAPYPHASPQDSH